MARVLTLVLSFTFLLTQSSVGGEAPSPTKTWRLVTELNEAEHALFDSRIDTPRDQRMSYLPAERYPFEPPYTAEEMGFRAMEFSHSPRWSCNLIDVTGTLTAQGYLHTNKMYSPIFYVPNASGNQGLAINGIC